MANLTEPISSSALELIRDKITEILIDEIPNQATLLADVDVNATVYRERTKPFAETDLPAITVNIQRSDSKKQNVTTNVSTILFMLDIYTKATYDEVSGVDGDEQANIKNQKIQRVVSGILSSTYYRKLQIPAGVVQKTTIVSYQPTELTNSQDAENVAMARLQFEVEATDGNEVEAAIELLKASTQATQGNSNKKYTWIWEK